VLHAKLNDGNILEALHRMQEADGKNTKSIVGAMKIKRKDLRSLN